MNNDDIADKTGHTPDDTWPSQSECPATSVDPYDEDFVWEPESPNEETIADPGEPHSDPYGETSTKDLLFAEPERAAEASEPFSPTPRHEPFTLVPFSPESTEETVRRGGLAYSAGIVFVVSVAFMLLLGWIADWMFGTKPWGLVIGIVLGSVIGFMQFFRITSQIFKNDKNDPAMRSLLDRDDEE